MYNGIGLPTPKGSGTSGYIQRNLADVRKRAKIVFLDDPENEEEPEEEPMSDVHKKPLNKEILEHELKRQIEVKCAEYSFMLEEQGYSEEEIERRVGYFRKILSHSNERDPEAIDCEIRMLRSSLLKPSEVKELQENQMECKKNTVTSEERNFNQLSKDENKSSESNSSYGDNFNDCGNMHNSSDEQRMLELDLNL